MLRKLFVVALGGVAAVVACQPEAFHNQASIGAAGRPGAAGTTGLAGTPGLAGATGSAGNIPILTGGNSGTGVAGAAGAVDTTGAAGAEGAPTGNAGSGGMGGVNTGAAGASAGAAGAATAGAAGMTTDGGSSMGGQSGTPDAGPRDTAPEAPPPSVMYPSSSLRASASITSAGTNDVASNAVDGNLMSRWSSGRNQQGGETFTVDLGKVESVSRVVLDDSTDTTDFPAAYAVEVSTDGTNYTMVATGKGMTVTDIRFMRVNARFIRVRQTGTTPVSWWSIDELRVYS